MIIPDEQIGKLTVRILPEGGGVRDAVSIEKRPAVTKSDIIVLVHGFNVNRKEGDDAYADFIQQFGKYFISGFPYNIYQLYYPADEKIKILSAISYPFQIGTAKISASRLYDFLQTEQGVSGRPLRMIFVAHSLGNRLVLETFGKGNVPHDFNWYFGMASAVPVFKVEDDGDLNKPAILPDKSFMLYSTSDPVLHWAFPPGQTAAGKGEGFFPQAVGRKGNPNAGVWDDRKEMNGYTHGSYWGGEESSNTIATAMGVPAPNMLNKNGIQTNTLPDQNKIPANNIASRSLSFRNLIGKIF
jgi:hypothetical protein